MPDRTGQQITDEAQVRGSEVRVYRAALRALHILADEFRMALSRGGYRVQALPPPSAWVAAVDELILPAIGDAYLTGGDLTLVAAGRRKRKLRQSALDTYLGPIRNRLVRVHDDVYDLIATNLSQARRDGATEEEMAERVDLILSDSGTANWPARASVIARTETTAAFNQGRMQAGILRADDEGVDRRDTYKEWLATRDDRTRPSHRHVSGEIVPITDRFRLESDQGVSFGFAPGDPGLPVWEVANCRCTLVILLPGDDGYPEVEHGWADTDVILAAYNEDQRRVPKGNGELSGRWVDTPGKVLRDLGDLVGDTLTGLDSDNDADLGEIVSRLRAKAADPELSAGDVTKLTRAAFKINQYASVDWSKAPIAKVPVGEMTLADVPASMSFPDHGRTKPGMRPLTPQDYVDHYNATGDRVPPGWTEVLAATEPYDPATHANRLRIQGIDSLGNPQPLMDQGWNEYKAGLKWERGDALIDHVPAIRDEITRDFATDPAAAALALQMVLGIRTGNTKDKPTKKGHTALGASTMPASAVRLDDDGTVHFDYIGKSGKRAELQTNDPLIADIMHLYLQGKSGDDRLFDVSDGSVNDYFDKVQEGLDSPVRFTPKDFRTMHGTQIATRLLSGRARAKDETEYAAIRKQVADEVSRFLNNTPTVALASYVAPTVWDGVDPNGGRDASPAAPVRVPDSGSLPDPPKGHVPTPDEQLAAIDRHHSKSAEADVAAYLDAAGYNEKPQVLSTAEFDAVQGLTVGVPGAQDGRPVTDQSEFWRGTTAHSGQAGDSGLAHHKGLTDAEPEEFYVGWGVYVPGTYIGLRETAQAFAGMSKIEGGTGGIGTPTVSFATPKRSMTRVKIHPKAKVGSWREMSIRDSSEEMIAKAVERGWDVIDLSSTEDANAGISVINRGVLIVEEVSDEVRDTR